jgi:hypothetical protein
VKCFSSDFILVKEINAEMEDIEQREGATMDQLGDTEVSSLTVIIKA